jgi:hypothetical protein
MSSGSPDGGIDYVPTRETGVRTWLVAPSYAPKGQARGAKIANLVQGFA